MKKGDLTNFKDSNGIDIKIGDDLDIIGTNQYNGTVNFMGGDICLETCFFNKPLDVHLGSLDFKECYIVPVDINPNSYEVQGFPPY